MFFFLDVLFIFIFLLVRGNKKFCKFASRLKKKNIVVFVIVKLVKSCLVCVLFLKNNKNLFHFSVLNNSMFFFLSPYFCNILRGFFVCFISNVYFFGNYHGTIEPEENHCFCCCCCCLIKHGYMEVFSFN